MNFYHIDIAVPGEIPRSLIVRAESQPPLKVVMGRLLLDETAEIHVRQINVVTWEF